MAERIGIFGGTFDPPHLGHLILASEARHQLRLTRLLWMLTPQSPHKQIQDISSATDRLEMVRCAIADQPAFELCLIEFERPAPQYTIDTVLAIRKKNPSAEVILLIGGDSLGSLVAWRSPLDLVAACHELGVMRRPGELVNLDLINAALPGLKEKARFVDTPLLEISSREIRRRIAEKLEYRYFLPPAVYEYIRLHHLYGA